jgi:hypothetical protein
MHRNVTGTSVKINCPTGQFYSPSIGQCTSCPAGQFYSSATGQCISCPAGQYSSTAGSTSCALCPAGRYSSTAGSISCALCPAGQYSSKDGSDRCALCPSGQYSSSPGAALCELCPTGQFSSPGSSSQTRCFPCSSTSHQCCWVLASWTLMGKAFPSVIPSSDNSCCNWLGSGITCDHTQKYVIKISWSSRALSGSIPAEIGNLIFLELL